MPGIWDALPPEINVGNLLGGPGVEMITAAATSYQNSALALLTAASNTVSTIVGMGETWNGESGDLAQAAFNNHTKWLTEQSQVAQSVSDVLHTVAAEFSAAQSAMATVGAWLAKNRAEQTLLAGANVVTGAAAIPLLLNQLEYFAIWGAAAAVMDGYEGAVVPTLSTLPPPALPEPIVTDPGVPPPPPKFEVPVYTQKSGTRQQFDGSTTKNKPTTDTTTTDNNINDERNIFNDNTGDKNITDTDPDNIRTDTTQSPTRPGTMDPSEITAPLSDSGSDAGADGAAEQSGFYGTSPNSPTLAGLNGGVGSLVALNLARGGLGSMPGASTGFRMPSNWLRGPGTAYGASSNPAGTAPAGRGAPRRGAIAPKAQMRRRRDEERKPGKVFVPGEQLDVPVLEKPPVIGVIEYADERMEEVVAEGDSLVGILESSDDDEHSDDQAAVAEPEPAR